MPDIREILRAMSDDDRALYIELRSNMRSAYLNAHNKTVGMGHWSSDDDHFLDLIDIKIGLLFDKSGRIEATEDIIGTDKAAEIEKALIDSKINGNAQAKAQAKAKSLTKVDVATGWQ